MDIRKIIRETLEESKSPIILRPKILTQQEMVSLGGNYHLQHGMLMNIPVDQIDGLDPTPGGWTDDQGEYHEFEPGVDLSKAKPIEVWYDDDSDKYMLYDGNHRVTQAKVNGDEYIKAFVQANSKDIYSKWRGF